MNGQTLGNVLGEDPATRKVHNLAVLTLEELPKEALDSQTSTALIINTEPSPTTDVGEHWVAIYGDKQSPVMEYFDSYGLPPFREALNSFFHRQKRPWIYNRRALQGEFSSTCGHYCLYYLLHRCRGHRMKDITLPFTENGNTNDKLVKDFIHSHFDIPRD